MLEKTLSTPLNINDKLRRLISNLLPLWLFSISIMVEGFPDPPISLEVAYICFGAACLILAALIIKKWLPLEILLISFYPFILLYGFDEISTAYKTPFIIGCAFILSVGVTAYHRVNKSGPIKLGIIIIAAVIATLVAYNANQGFWELTNELGVERCFLDAYGCPKLTGNETPWWRMMLGF